MNDFQESNAVFAWTTVLSREQRNQMHLYPEVLEVNRGMMIDALRRSAREAGFGHEQTVPEWLPEKFFFWTDEDIPVECAEDEADFIHTSVEARYARA